MKIFARIRIRKKNADPKPCLVGRFAFYKLKDSSIVDSVKENVTCTSGESLFKFFRLILCHFYPYFFFFDLVLVSRPNLTFIFDLNIGDMSFHIVINFSRHSLYMNAHTFGTWNLKLIGQMI